MRLLNEKSVLPYVEGDDAFQAASEEFLNQINIQFLSFKIN